MFLKNLLNIDNIYAIHLCLKQMSFKQLASLQNLCQHYVDHSKTHNITDIYSGHYFKASLIQKFDNHTKTIIHPVSTCTNLYGSVKYINNYKNYEQIVMGSTKLVQDKPISICNYANKKTFCLLIDRADKFDFYYFK